MNAQLHIATRLVEHKANDGQARTWERQLLTARREARRRRRQGFAPR